MIKAEWTNKDSLDLQPTCNQLATTEGDLISRAEAVKAIYDRVAEVNSIGMAESVLREVPSADRPTHDSDFISRDSLLKQLDERYCKPCQSRKDDYNGVRCRACWVDDAVGEIEDALSVVPVIADRPSGEWLRKEKEYNDCDGHRAYYWYECSECGAKPPKDQWKNEWHSPYCPSCGARIANTIKAFMEYTDTHLASIFQALCQVRIIVQGQR